jgi:valacyclovir hydrolase
MAWFEHDSSRIYFEELGSGVPVLLLPGFSDSIEGEMPLRQALATGYRVIAADLPGSGRSGPQPRTYTETYFEDDAAAFTAFLEQLGTGPTHLIGFSDGGETSLLMAALKPGMARSVVTWGAGGALSDPTGQLRQAMLSIIDHPIPPLQDYRDYLVSYYGEANARAMTQSETRAIGDIIEHRGGDVSLSKAGNITCPVLLIAGSEDMFVPRPVLDNLAAHLRVAEVAVAEGAGHDVQHSCPEWLANTMLDWLSRH